MSWMATLSRIIVSLLDNSTVYNIFDVGDCDGGLSDIRCQDNLPCALRGGFEYFQLFMGRKCCKDGTNRHLWGEVFISISIPGIESSTFIAFDGSTFSFCMSIFSINSISSCPGRGW